MEEKGKFVRRRLKLAQERFQVAKLLVRHRNYRDAISRAYYTMFYAAKAFLLTKGKDPSSHKGVKILFHQFCTTEKNLEPALARMLSAVQEERLEADNDAMSLFPREDAQ